MELKKTEWTNELRQILSEFQEKIDVKPNQVLVIGCSTSEVAGESIGTAGSYAIAELIFKEFDQFRKQTGIELAFQCCEHLNRALVLERQVQERLGLEEVTVVPVREAGGSMAAYAYRKMDNPVVVEFIKADYAIDIGDTFVGMHLKHVAVPVRVSLNQMGSAHVTLAKTRPKLIGGQRAVYQLEVEEGSCD